MFQNVHYPVATLAPAPVKSPRLCMIQFFKWEDVLTWPEVDPETGILASAVTLKPSKFIYTCNAIDPTKSFSEVQKGTPAGLQFEITAKASLEGSSAAHILTLGTMIYHQWGLILRDKSGVYRLIGNQDSGADLSFEYTSGEGNESRKTSLVWKWEHPLPAPIYSANAFTIIIGGGIITAGCITFITRFQVGAAGSPMAHGDNTFISSLLVNKKALVIVDGMALPVDDGTGAIDWTGSVQRRIEKATASNTIVFVGNVVQNEIVEIYGYV